MTAFLDSTGTVFVSNMIYNDCTNIIMYTPGAFDLPLVGKEGTSIFSKIYYGTGRGRHKSTCKCDKFHSGISEIARSLRVNNLADTQHQSI